MQKYHNATLSAPQRPCVCLRIFAKLRRCCASLRSGEERKVPTPPTIEPQGILCAGTCQGGEACCQGKTGR